MRTPTIAAAVVATTVAFGGAASAYAETITFTGSGGAVPDGNPAGALFEISVPDTRSIRAAGNNVTLTLIGVRTPATGWIHPVGGLVDFAATLEHVGSGAPRSVFTNVLNQGNFICLAGLDGTYTFRSGEPTTLRSQCGSGGVGSQPGLIPPGTYRTTAPDDTTDSGLSSAWNAQPAAGRWRLHISDTNVNTVGGQFVMNSTWTWRLDIEVEPRATPTPSPSNPQFPSAAFADCPTATANLIHGTLASESIVGTPRADRIFAGTGNDIVDGLAGSDCIDLGPGTDGGQGGDGNDLIVGGLGADRMSGNLGNDRLRGGSAGDRLIGGFGNDRLHGQSGSDRINAERGRDRVNGGSSNDVISAGSSGDRVAGDQGNDRINGNSGSDSLSGNSGNDRITGSSGLDRLSGNSGNDRISARDGRRDRVNCGRGRDSVVADRADRVAPSCELVRRR